MSVLTTVVTQESFILPPFYFSPEFSPVHSNSTSFLSGNLQSPLIFSNSNAIKKIYSHAIVIL